jgi:hypothetical protein
MTTLIGDEFCWARSLLGTGSLGVWEISLRIARNKALRHIQSVMAATHPYSSSIIIRLRIRGFTLSRIPEVYTLYLEKEAQPTMNLTHVLRTKA